MASDQMKRKLAAILSADVKGTAALWGKMRRGQSVP